jgi:hypothetical protein
MDNGNIIVTDKTKKEKEEEKEPLTCVFISADAPIVVAYKMYEHFEKLGHTTHYIKNLDTLVEYMNYHNNPTTVGYYSSMGNPFSLKTFIEFAGYDDEDLDIIFIEQNFIYFENDVETPVIYYHRDLWSEVFIRKPDLLLYRFGNHYTALQYISRQTWSNTKYKLQFLNGVDMDERNPDREKVFKGLNYIYPHIPLENYLTRDFVQRDYYAPTFDVVSYAKERNWLEIHGQTKTSIDDYFWTLESCEALLFIPPNNAYTSRILYDCAASKVLLVIMCPNGFAETQYKKLGLISGNNCIIVKSPKQIMNSFVTNTRKGKKEKIIENAYEWVKNRHTYEIRAKELEKMCYKLIEHLKEDRAMEIQQNVIDGK